MKTLFVVSALISALLVTSGLTYAEDQKRDQDRTQLQEDQDQEQIYGSQLMTQEERMQHRAQMRSAATEAEREQIRYEHHERMVMRAKERGVSIPDEMPPRGYKMGTGKGMGPGGMGPNGMGPNGMGSGAGAGKGS